MQFFGGKLHGRGSRSAKNRDHRPNSARRHDNFNLTSLTHIIYSLRFHLHRPSLRRGPSVLFSRHSFTKAYCISFMVVCFSSLSRSISTSLLLSSRFLRKTNHTQSIRKATMATPARTQPPWKAPNSSVPPKLAVYNSLTRTKNDFIPINEKEVTWYSCGPTV